MTYLNVELQTLQGIHIVKIEVVQVQLQSIPAIHV